jgi:hypothetical protein
VCLALAVTLGLAEDDSVGFVLEKHGEWLLEGPSPRLISEGDRIPGGAKLRPKEGRRGEDKSTITICLYTGQAKVYTGAATLPARYDPSLVNRLWRAIAGRYSGGYVHALSRGRGISDGVVRRENQRIDLSPVFHAEAAGEFRVRFTPVPGNAAKATGPVTLRFVRSPEQLAPAGSGELRPGLYECTIVDHKGQPKGDSTAWVLVAGAADFGRATAKYREAVDLSEKWDDNVSPYAVVSFRRACLKSMAEPIRP